MNVQVPPVPPLPSVPVIISGGMPMDPGAIVTIVIAALAAATLIFLPLIRALARRLEGKSTHQNTALQAEVEDLRARVHELEGGQARMLELEERLDFTERIIAQKQEPLRLPDGA